MSKRLDLDRPNVLSGLIWIQSVCKGYEPTTLVGNELKCLRKYPANIRYALNPMNLGHIFSSPEPKAHG